MKTLIVVDVQKDFCKGGNLAVPNADEIVKGINEIMSDYDIVVYTQDWHPENHKSFASQWEGKEPFEQADLNGIPQVLWPDHCVQYSDGAEFHPELVLKYDESVYFTKGENPEIDSYSGFFENDKKTPTGLENFLKMNGVVDVDVVGLALDFCVRYTAEDAQRLGFKTRVLTDLTRAIGEVKPVCEELEKQGIVCL
jgi:nicotinamidase/pyrazinamidase